MVNLLAGLQDSLQEKKTPFLSESDLTGATLALLRLQRTYNLSTER